MHRAIIVGVLVLWGCQVANTPDAGGDAGLDAGVPAEPVCDPPTPGRPGSGTYPCRALEGVPCRADPDAQRSALCSNQPNFFSQYAVCGAIEVLTRNDGALLRECIYADGGLVGFRQLSDEDGSPDSFMAGRWKHDCDAGVQACVGADAGTDAGTSCIPATTQNCRPLDGGPCAPFAAAQGAAACSSSEPYVDHGTCGTIDLWRLSGDFYMLACIYEDGGLIGMQQGTDMIGSPSNYVAGRWETSCVPDPVVACGRCEPSDGGPLGCQDLSISTCQGTAAAQAASMCFVDSRTHGVCGAIEVWEDAHSPYYFRRCVYEDGGLVGSLEVTDRLRVWRQNYTAGQWNPSCVADVDAGC